MRRWEIKWLRRQKGHTTLLQWTQGIFHPTFLNGTNVDSSGVSKLGMALGRLLLLCLVAFEVWDAETKPIKFVCDQSTRRAFSRVAELESALSNCNGSSPLSAPVWLPCVELHVASWEIKSQQEKRGDIVASLKLLVEGVEVARALSQIECATSLLQSLEKRIKNYLLIMGNLQLRQEATMSLTLSCVPRSTHSLSTVLQHYKHLINGKLERFMVSLDDRCTTQ